MTYWSSDDNYGQVLQCYALQAYLHLQGHDVFLIKYIPECQSTSFLQKIRKNLSWKKFLYMLGSQRKIDRQNYAVECKLKKINHQLNASRKFDSFREKYICSTEIIYHSLQELRNNPPQADVYICGSDQVWNNQLDQPETAAWYLAFGGRDVKRVSYAASIGRTLEKKEKVCFKKYLSVFDAISVREESTRLLCKSIGINNVLVTLDPTLLLPVEEYRRFEPKIKDSLSIPYLFIYILNVTRKEEIYWEQIQDFLKEKHLDCKIICSSGYLQAREIVDGYKNIQATVPEWIHYIDQAAFVVTTSFHGVVFCVKMHKPFLAILLTNKYSKGNDRIVSLLHSLDLSDRIYDSNLPIDIQIQKKIDWERTEQKISALKKVSCDFLNLL